MERANVGSRIKVGGSFISIFQSVEICKSEQHHLQSIHLPSEHCFGAKCLGGPLFPYRPEIPQEMVRDSPATKRCPRFPYYTERCPAAPSGKRSPRFLFSVVTCCTSALLFHTFIPHTLHGEISNSIPLKNVMSNNMMSPSLRFKSIEFERFFVINFILSHGTACCWDSNRTDESFSL